MHEKSIHIITHVKERDDLAEEWLDTALRSGRKKVTGVPTVTRIQTGRVGLNLEEGTEFARLGEMGDPGAPRHRAMGWVGSQFQSL